MKNVVLLLAVTTGLLTACNDAGNAGAAKSGADSMAMARTNSAESKTERNKKVIMASFDAMAAHNAAETMKDATADCMDYGDGSMPPMKGKDSIMKMMDAWMAAFPDSKGSDLKYVADGDWVMVWGEWSGTFKNDFMGMKATNKMFKYKDVDIFKLNDEGKVTEHHNVQSPQMIMMQVGAKMPAPPKK